MKKRTIIIFLIFLIIFTFIIIYICNSNNDNKFEYSFTKEEQTFIQDNNILFDDIKPYLVYKSFNLFDFLKYEEKRKEENYLEAINLVNNPNFYSEYTTITPALFNGQNNILVNKHYYLEKTYIPKNLVDIKTFEISHIERPEGMKGNKEALENLFLMFNEAKKEGINLTVFSSYRDYTKQNYLYYEVNNQNDTVVARPGHSEHQTGLAFDISSKDYGLTLDFANSKEYQFLKENCYKYGFIERYQENKTKYTLYSYEPWHFRYVGKTLSSHLYVNDYSLEEYIIKNFELN